MLFMLTTGETIILLLYNLRQKKRKITVIDMSIILQNCENIYQNVPISPEYL